MVELQQQQDTERYEEFLRLFTRERERMFAFIYSMIPRQADAEDVFQRASLVLWRKFNEFRQGEDFLAWACGVAHYEIRNYFRTAGRDRLYLDEELVQQLAIERVDSLSRFDERIVDHHDAADVDMRAGIA